MNQPKKPATKNLKSPEPYNKLSGLWTSFAVTSTLAILNILFLTQFLTRETSFFMFTFSRAGVSTHLLDITVASYIATLVVVISALMTLFIAILTYFNSQTWTRLFVILHIALSGALLISFISGVVYKYTNMLTVGIVAFMIMVLIAVAVVVYTNTFTSAENSQQKKPLNKKGKK